MYLRFPPYSPPSIIDLLGASQPPKEAEEEEEEEDRCPLARRWRGWKIDCLLGFHIYFWQIKSPAASAAAGKGTLPRLRLPPPLTKQRRTEGTSAAAAYGAVVVVVAAAAAPSSGQSPAWPYDRR